MKEKIKYKFEFPLSHNPIPYQNEIRRSKYGGMYKTAKLKYYQEQLAFFALSEMNANNWKLIEDKYKIKTVFFCKDKRHGDITNMFKSFEDAMENVVYTNDKNCIKQTTSVKYDKLYPRIECEISA